MDRYNTTQSVECRHRRVGSSSRKGPPRASWSFRIPPPWSRGLDAPRCLSYPALKSPELTIEPVWGNKWRDPKRESVITRARVNEGPSIQIQLDLPRRPLRLGTVQCSERGSGRTLRRRPPSPSARSHRKDGVCAVCSSRIRILHSRPVLSFPPVRSGLHRATAVDPLWDL